jgi:hypothetical protein
LVICLSYCNNKNNFLATIKRKGNDLLDKQQQSKGFDWFILCKNLQEKSDFGKVFRACSDSCLFLAESDVFLSLILASTTLLTH